MKKKNIFTLLLALALSCVCVMPTVGCKKDGNDSSLDDSSSSVTSSSSENSTEDGKTDIRYELSLGETAHTVMEDDSFRLNVNVSPVGAVKWTVSDPTILSVEGNAEYATVLAKKCGTATVTATCGNAAQSCTVTVTANTANSTILVAETSSYALEAKGEAVALDFVAYELTADGAREKIENAEIVYTSSEKLATVSDGKLNGIRSGITQVQAQYGDVVATASVTVYDAFIADTAAWNKMVVGAKMGEYYLLTADLDFQDKAYASVYEADANDDTTKAFRAKLHGNGHSVKNVSLTGGANTYVSLFGKVNNGAEICDIAFENISVGGINAQGAGFASAIGGTATVRNVYLDMQYTSVPKNGGVLAYNVYGGTIEGVVAKVRTPSGNTQSDNVAAVVYGANNATIQACYVLGEGSLTTTAGVQCYTSAVEMAWDINAAKALDGKIWQYAGGVAMPALIKK